MEEFLDGEEASFFALIDGESCVALASAQVMPANACHHSKCLMFCSEDQREVPCLEEGSQ